jgi:hypothetical protein
MTAMSDLARRAHGVKNVITMRSLMFSRKRRSGSDLASRWFVRIAMILPALFTASSCLVTDTDPTPNRNSPPRILMPDIAGSMTTPPEAMFHIAEGPPIGIFKRDLELRLSVADDDSRDLVYRVFLIGQDLEADAGATGFGRRFLIEDDIPVNDEGLGKLETIIVRGDRFIPTGRCYGVEIRVTSSFRDASNGADPTLPAQETDIDSIIYWVASYGPTDTSIDLTTCPVQP